MEIFNQEAQWLDFYDDAKEEIPAYVPESLGKWGNITGDVDVDHANDQLTHHINTGILIFFNLVPIIWHYKRQATIKSSTFRSEVFAISTTLYII